MRIMLSKKLILGFLSVLALGCRTPNGQSQLDAEEESPRVAGATNLAQLPFSIRDVDYEIRSFLPLTIFVTKDSLMTFLRQRVAEKQKDFTPPANNEVKNVKVSNIEIDLAEGGLDVNFRLNFSFRKCVGKACGWWQPAQTTNRLKLAIVIDDWVLSAKLTDVKVYVDNDFLNAMIGDLLAREIAKTLTTEINRDLNEISGKTLQEVMSQSLPERQSMLSNLTSFDATIQADGVLLTLSRRRASE